VLFSTSSQPDKKPVCVYVCVFVSVYVSIYVHVVARMNSCKSMVLLGSISYFLATRSSQMNAEAANDVDPKY